MSETLDKLAADLGERLLARSCLLACAESCTGGWISKVVTDIPGSSAWFDRGFVTYSNRAKQDMLGVSAASLAKHGAVSAEVVAEMASGALARSRADLAVAVSGVAGPGGGSDEKPVGTVFFAWVLFDREPVVQRLLFAGEREEVRHQTVRVALARLLELMDDGV
jgi:nicotinamide-nucleotide amidase